MLSPLFFLAECLPSKPILSTVVYVIEQKIFQEKSTEKQTRVFGFSVQFAKRYTIETTVI